MLSALKSAMELRNPADTEQLLDCIFAYADSNKLPPDTVRNICVYIHQFGMELQFPGMAGHSLEGGSISSLKRIMETNSIAEDGILHPRTRAANAGHGAEQHRQRRPYRFLGTGLYQRTLR